MQISQEKLKQKLVQVAKKFVNDDAAIYFGDEIIETHLRKAPRTNPLKDAVNDLAACLRHKDQKILYLNDKPSYIAINFKGHGPSPYIKNIHDFLIERSKKNGIAMVAFQNSQSMHTLHLWVQGLAKKGLVALAGCNGGPGAVVPLNGTHGLFGTNPLAFGIPGQNGAIHCVDMATSEIPYFQIMDAHKNKTLLPEKSAVDKNGNLTNSASAALDFSTSETDPVSNLLPIGGGYKGFLIIYLMELLTSGLIGMPSSPEMSNDFIPEEHGSFILVFNPHAMGSSETLGKSVSSIHSALTNQPAKTGTSIPIPGNENTRRFHESANRDIEIDDIIYNKLKSLI